MVDRTGADAESFTETPEGRVPVIGDAHRKQMIRDLYGCGWSYRLIAQALKISDEDAMAALFGRQ